MAGAMGHGGWGAMRSLRRDQDLLNQPVQREHPPADGHVRPTRIGRPARDLPHCGGARRRSSSSINPLILRNIINIIQFRPSTPATRR